VFKDVKDLCDLEILHLYQTAENKQRVLISKIPPKLNKSIYADPYVKAIEWYLGRIPSTFNWRFASKHLILLQAFYEQRYVIAGKHNTYVNATPYLIELIRNGCKYADIIKISEGVYRVKFKKSAKEVGGVCRIEVNKSIARWKKHEKTIPIEKKD